MLFGMFAALFRDPRNGGIFANIRTRRESASATGVAATARMEGFDRKVEASPDADSSSQVLRSQDIKYLENDKTFGEAAKGCAADTAAAAPTFKSRAPPVVGDFDKATPEQGGHLPDGDCAAKDTAAISQPLELRENRDRDRALTPSARRLDQTRKGSASELPPPERAFDSPTTAIYRDHSDNSRNRGNCETRGNGKLGAQPGVSKLRAPGWGLDAAINSIPPAPSSMGAVKPNVSLAAAPGDKGPVSAMFLPRDLLTPVTEVATVDEQSVVSCSTRRTARNTPASSETLGHMTNHVAPCAGMRGRFCSPSQSGGHGQRRGSGANQLEPPAQRSDGRRQCQQGVGKWGGWGIGSVGVAHSAPGDGTKGAPGFELASGVPSLSSHRSPLCGAEYGNNDGRLTSLSTGCPRRGSGGQAAGGYIAAMSRRARSIVRCEAARRLAAVARATDKARPSTPISERARWGKGRETQVEVERRKLLQKRSKYAIELQRKVKVNTDDECDGLKKIAL